MESELMMMRRLLGMTQENEAQAQAQASRTAGGYNSGTQGSFTNNGSGSQNFRDVNYNSGAYSGNRYSYPYYHNNGGNFVHNSGYVRGNGNGCIVNNNGNSPVPSNKNSYY
ncbi:hypothetical protein QN277_026876 [Acacia crassicarpa]|uniref:Uncharacterized protein n=1 Tax=Acacia crassicarpa TaxID=499986 RepID=A0AAE1MIA6_9FABA|nr:hypothetical protein QN277_026876 [Acacia crassicarpa]